MISFKSALVSKVAWSRRGIQCLEVELEGDRAKALNYSFLTGEACSGHCVVLNTTASDLGLGSGGYHFVLFNYSRASSDLTPYGHIIKLRYTPIQLKVNTYEEKYCSRKNFALEPYRGLKNTPVILGELHSMLAPYIIILKKLVPGAKLAYLMTDNAALPLYMSNIVHRLKTSGFLQGSITCGHAFGGDLETVNFYTALIAAKEKLKADVIISTPGPGVVGTSTRYGNSGIEQGEQVDRVIKMKGIPVAIPRISFADSRKRHYGISHHTLTALGEISFCRALFPLPCLSGQKMTVLYEQLYEAGIIGKHDVIAVKIPKLLGELSMGRDFLSTMGRGLKEDPSFFASVAASAYITAKKFLNY